MARIVYRCGCGSTQDVRRHEGRYRCTTCRRYLAARSPGKGGGSRSEGFTEFTEGVVDAAAEGVLSRVFGGLARGIANLFD